MFLKALHLVVLALSLVRAAPSVADTNASLSERFAIPCVMVNVGMNGTAFTFDTPPDDSDLELLLPMIWKTPNQIGTGQFLTVNQSNDHIITSDNLEAIMFSVDHAGEGHLIIKLPDADKVFEAIYEGTNTEYARVALRPANGGRNQLWKFTSGLD
ncbi:hypothetical protein FB45DRAFT_1064007 [Roridomyces roridus]|uniref:Ricin B lectin domain-containing protein n=1 Tax=Roridomyces roridus TaxID=1738132 RepID=A0AAD7FD18_9AGAR|nr:hypothetical protein FB45DRAFT_1064007 [Roridomyces roridus]